MVPRYQPNRGRWQGSSSQRRGHGVIRKVKTTRELVVREPRRKSREGCTVSNVAKSSWQAKTGYGSLASANKKLVGDVVRAVAVRVLGICHGL